MVSSGTGRWWLVALGLALVLLGGAGFDVLRRAHARNARQAGVTPSSPALQPPAQLEPRRERLEFPSVSAAASPSVPLVRPSGPEKASDLASTPRKPAHGVWTDRALCGPGSPKISEWARYLQGFRDVPVDGATLHADFTVKAREIERTARLIGFARSIVQQATRLDVLPPEVYVHRDVATLRKYSCVAGNAVAFYDGAIHVADVASDQKLRGELWLSVVHEYTHHALFSHGIREPIWFQEGLAMHVAREPWRNFDISPPGFDMREMVDGFPHSAPPESAERFYGQAYQMLEFVRGLCREEWDCGYPALVGELRRGAAPSTFFQDTIARLLPRSSAPPLELWKMYFAGLRPAQ